MIQNRTLALVVVVVLTACVDTGSNPTTTTPGTVTSTDGVSTTASSAPASSSTATTQGPPTTIPPGNLVVEAFPVPSGSRPHDVAPAVDGGVWYTAQGVGELGWLDPATGDVTGTPLGPGSRPHGVIVDDRGVPWVTDGGLNAIVSVDPETLQVTVYRLPDDRRAVGMHTATFDPDGVLWFTGNSGVYGSFDPGTGEIEVYDAPNGRGPYGITTTPGGVVYYASLAGSYVGEIGPDDTAVVHTPPTPGQGARRVWSDSSGNVWVSEWNTGNLSRLTPATGAWETWKLPGERPATYAVYVDENDIIWASDFGGNAIVRFDPMTEDFTVVDLPHSPGEVRQLHGRDGEVWGAESAADQLVLIRTR